MRTSGFVGFTVKALVVLAMTALLGAPTCNQPFGPVTTGSGSTGKVYNAFGDSIAAGYEATSSFPGQIKSYVGYYADDAAADQDWTITYRGITTSGETTSQIDARMKSNLSRLREAQIFSWDAGGNDFLDARGDYYSNCNVAQLDSALDAWRGDWDALVDTVAGNVGVDAPTAPIIRTMNVYYPNPAQDAQGSCNGQSHMEVLLPRLLAAGDYMCATAEARGWRCADTIAAMNCDEDGSGNPDFDCPNKRWLQDVIDSGICPRNVTSPAYGEATVDPACLHAHLDATDAWAAFRDPVSVNKGSGNVTLIQTRDDTHPNAAGHDHIGAAHHATGYDDVEGDQVEDTYALCIDYQDNDGDGDADCADSECAAYCN